MTGFERELVNSLNEWFRSRQTPGIAYRFKQSRFTSQNCDVVADSHDFYLGFECKSMRADKKNKLYFSSHFSEADGTHQIENLNEFFLRSGRIAFLAVELSFGRGKPKEAYLIPWSYVLIEWEGKDNSGFSVEEIKDKGMKLERENADYIITDEVVEYIEKMEEERKNTQLVWLS